MKRRDPDRRLRPHAELAVRGRDLLDGNTEGRRGQTGRARTLPGLADLLKRLTHAVVEPRPHQIELVRTPGHALPQMIRKLGAGHLLERLHHARPLTLLGALAQPAKPNARQVLAP